MDQGRLPTRNDVNDGPADVGPYLVRVIWTLAGLSGLLLGLRLFSKIWRGRLLWWDDHVLIAAWISLVVSIVLQTVGVGHGLGRHYSTMTLEQESMVSMLSISAGFASILAASWSKTSFALSLLRVSTGRIKMVVWAVTILVNIVFGISGLIQWVQCWPIEKRWNWSVDGSCWPSIVIQNYNTFSAAFSGMMDIVLAMLPWRIVWNVSINKREWVGALLAMSMGVFAGVMAFLKIRTVYTIGNDNTTTVDLFIFGTAEPATAIMAASVPVLRALVKRETKAKPPQFIELSENVKTEKKFMSHLKVSDLERVHSRSLRLEDPDRDETCERTYSFVLVNVFGNVGRRVELHS